MQLIDGKAVSSRVLKECKAQVEELVQQGCRPGLAVVLVGDDAASRAYVRSKERTCKDLGIYSVKLELPSETSQEELQEVIVGLNENPDVDGILVQSPPPSHIDEGAVVMTIDPDKDVDGFHPVNVAKLVLEDVGGFIPCTPLGCQRLLGDYGIKTQGAHVVIVGRSMIVGKPMAMLLMSKGLLGDATVTIAHSRTVDLPEVCRSADILIAAVGRPEFIGGDHIKEGAVVIDVGINRVEDPRAKRGYRLVGDVNFDEASQRCSAITPVPGGVGPMTIAMLMSNTVKACLQRRGLELNG
ncbi:MAG: bifunctional methylenetetrahydrofolate dehydrogenase/methenyltetrahydrofolate cyclohydrolase FolD [Verrucomicrobiaceae bacterium]|nr:bifunctional methylenetetrahydrofolate dehydrogenase/methenyltetrahydrofolate cyclohydrolase FolD [Verrucomicrobiaceae bacterium]